MKTKYVCHGVISPYAIFHNNLIMGTNFSFVKFCRWGGGAEK